MTIREQVFGALSNDATLKNTYGIDVDRTYIRGAVWERPSTEGPWLVVAWGPVTPGIGRVSTVTLDVWVYNDGGDFSAINEIIARIKTIMLNLTATGDAIDDEWFVGVRWMGNGPDFADDVYSAVGKTTSFTITASGL